MLEHFRILSFYRVYRCLLSMFMGSQCTSMGTLHAAYLLRIHLHTPFRNRELTPQMQAYNSAMSEVRSSVLWLFGDVINYFKFFVLNYFQFILFNFPNYSPSIAMELEVSKEITCKWQNQRPETNKYVSWALFLKLQAAGVNFEKLLGWTVFKNPNFNPFQSSSVLPIRGICCFCYVILTFL